MKRDLGLACGKVGRNILIRVRISDGGRKGTSRCESSVHVSVLAQACRKLTATA